MILGLEKNLTKFVRKWPKYGQKLFTKPKIGPKCGFRPKNYFWLIWSKNDQKMAKRTEKGPKSDFRPWKFL